MLTPDQILGQHTKDIVAEDNLRKVGLSIGDTVYWNTPLDAYKNYKNRRMIVVGHNGAHPIVAFNDDGGTTKEAGILYEKNDNVHSAYQKINWPSFPLNRNQFQTEAQYKDCRSDKFMTDELSRFGFRVGDEIEYNTTATGLPIQTSLGTAVSPNKIKGYVAGYSNGFITIAVDGPYGSQSNHILNSSVHSAYRNPNKKFLQFSRNSIKKPSQRQPSAHVPHSVSFPVGFHKVPVIEQVAQALEQAARAKQAKGRRCTVFPETATMNLVLNKANPLKTDLKKAGYRIVAKQGIKITHGAMCNYLKSKGSSNEKVAALSTVLETEYGKAAMSIVIGLGLEQLPFSKYSFTKDSIPEHHLTQIAKEFRINGMTIAGNELIETIFKSALEVMINQSSVSKIRVSADEATLIEDHFVIEDATTQGKKLSA